MPRFILTGAPGAGKTSLLHALKAEGFPVVAEAATDVIARRHARGDDEPWRRPDFTERIVRVQRRRQLAAVLPDAQVQLFDRSPVCTWALALHLGRPVGPALAAELDRIASGRIYHRRVLLVRNLGFVTPTAARRISFEESLLFEARHEACYRALGYELLEVAPLPLAERAAMARRLLGA